MRGPTSLLDFHARDIIVGQVNYLQFAFAEKLSVSCLLLSLKVMMLDGRISRGFTRVM